MSGVTLVRRMPPWVVAITICVLYPPYLLLRYLLGTTFGVFLSSIGIYAATWFLGESKPYSMQQLVLWIDGLPIEATTAVFTSLITVFGFLIAFRSATLNWKEQALSELKIIAAGEIEHFFTEAQRLTVDAEIYIKSLLEVSEAVDRTGYDDHNVFLIRTAMEKSAAFLKVRDRLVVMSIEVHTLAGRHHALLASVWGVRGELDDCVKAFSEICKAMWVQIPSVLAVHPDPLPVFVERIDRKQCEDFIDCCKKNYSLIGGVSGGIRGVLLMPVIPFNSSALFYLTNRLNELVNALKKIRTRQQ
jgi:hypothetical protein